MCPDCAAGRKVPPCAGTTARARVLVDNGLALARIDALWEVRSDAAAGRGKGRGKGRRAATAEEAEYAATLRWYCVPEQTHVGRQVSAIAILLLELVCIGSELETRCGKGCLLAVCAAFEGQRLGGQASTPFPTLSTLLPPAYLPHRPTTRRVKFF